MSHSFLPKKASNVLNQENLDRLLVVLRQPFSIAVFASLAVHGLLWAALPSLFSEQQKEPEPQRRVQVVELSPAEQSHLPPLGINPLPTLLPTKPSPPVQSGTKLPDPTKLYNDSSLDSMPVFPLPPPNIALPDFSNLFPKTTLPETKKEPKKQTATTDKGKNPPAPPDPETPKKDPGKPEGKTGEPARSATLSPDQVAALQKDAERSRQLQALYTFNGPRDKAERAEIGDKNLAKFYDSAARLSAGNYKTKYYGTTFLDKGNISDLFPGEACPYVKGATVASVAAIIKPDGQLAEAPSVLVPSGYIGLDNTAIEYVAKKNYAAEEQFKTDGNYQIIRFNFFFDPKSACSSSSGKPT